MSFWSGFVTVFVEVQLKKTAEIEIEMNKDNSKNVLFLVAIIFCFSEKATNTAPSILMKCKNNRASEKKVKKSLPACNYLR